MADERRRSSPGHAVSAMSPNERGSSRLAVVKALALAVSLPLAAVQPPAPTLEEQLGNAEDLIGERRYSAALSLLDEIARFYAIEVERGDKVGEDFWFRHARVARLARHPGQAVESAMRYLAIAGTTAEHYTDALDLAAAARLQIDRDQSLGLQRYRDLRARLEVERDRIEGAFADPLESGGYGPEMVVVPAGRFYMGCPAEDYRCWRTEKPVRRVRVAAFAMSRHEATFAEWDACVAAKGCRGYLPPDETWGRGARPVVNVSWEDALTYVAWLSEETGSAYRLPTEAEWEYAARAGSGAAYSWGDSVGVNRANCDDCGSRWDDRRTAPAASFAPNAFGLYDMHGNVNEWVEDCFYLNYEGAPSDGSARANEGCGTRVLRGGAWVHPATFITTSERVEGSQWSRSYKRIDGFRVARDAPSGYPVHAPEHAPDAARDPRRGATVK